MRTAFFYDAESTGLIEYGKSSDDPTQPDIVQLAAELVDIDTRRTIASFNHLIKPAGWSIPADVEALTSISTERAAMFGLDLRIVLYMFLSLWGMATVHRVGHNEAFDARLIRIAIKRDSTFSEGFADQWKAGAAFCTCQKSKPIVNLPATERMLARGLKGPKSPDLGEAYEFFTGEPLKNAHDAAVDVAACKAIYFGLLDTTRSTFLSRADGILEEYRL